MAIALNPLMSSASETDGARTSVAWTTFGPSPSSSSAQYVPNSGSRCNVQSPDKNAEIGREPYLTRTIRGTLDLDGVREAVGDTTGR